MVIEFDPAKDAINQRQHGVSLGLGARILGAPGRVIIPSLRLRDGEERFKVVGMVEGRLFTGVFTWRGTSARFISVRRSNNGEERSYRAAG